MKKSATRGRLPHGATRRREARGTPRLPRLAAHPNAIVSALKSGGARFRSEVEVGPGAKQIQIQILTEIQLSFMKR